MDASRKKILFVGPKYHYMKPEQGESFVFHYFWNTLQRMPGIQADFIPFERMYEVGRDAMNAQIFAYVRDVQPDMLFVILFREELNKEMMRTITQHTSVVTIAWCSDDQWRFQNYSRLWAPCFTWMVTTNPRAKEQYAQIGYRNVIVSQWAWNPAFFPRDGHLQETHDVTFVGEPHGTRKRFIVALSEKGFKVECWGYGWPQGMRSQQEMCRIFSESKINLNFNKSSGHIDLRTVAKIFGGKNPEGKGFRLFPPQLWMPNMRSLADQFSDQIKLRNFEVPGCGGFLLAEYVQGLEKYYEIGREIDCFSGIEELVEKTRYYLEHEEKRREIAHAGYLRTLRDHTFEKRFHEIFQTVGFTV